jgi:tRNA(fMet)-specific endonuclease VapC
MYCLDTNILIAVFRGDKELSSKIEAMRGMSDVFVTPITLCELYKGAYAYYDTERIIRNIEDFISSFEVLDFNQNACKEFGKLYSKLKNSGGMIPETDIMIASIAKENDLTLITRDKNHFEKTGVKVEEW